MRRLAGALSSPMALRRFHFWCIVVWALLWMLAGLIGWIQLVAFISHVTMATAMLTSFAAYCASRVEVKQDENGDAS